MVPPYLAAIRQRTQGPVGRLGRSTMRFVPDEWVWYFGDSFFSLPTGSQAGKLRDDGYATPGGSV